MDLFTPFDCRDVTARNRVMVSPMCQYSCEDEDGLATDWHLVHLGSRAAGGAGIVMSEATAVTPRGRISPKDLGIWSDDHADALAPVTEFIAEQGATSAIQLAHAGRKASTNRPGDGGGPVHGDRGWTPVGPTTEPWPHDEPLSTERLDAADIERITEAFTEAAVRAVDAGFDIVELHAAHGYLLHEFLSPVTNTREDDYGGSFENRTRFLREVVVSVREAIPEGTPLFVRISATDWLPDRESWTVDDSTRLAAELRPLGVDLIDVSAGAIHPDQQVPDTGPHYQVPYAEQVAESGVPVGTVGKITTPEGADEIIRNGRAALAIVGREHLRDPYFALHAAESLGYELPVPRQYTRGFQ
ncbi:NamA family oxidoreductase [Natronomonas pharaonis DSM 2160]|uniref:NamA family oxidoreductase n=1 Tax=Natronomonas pharaonis (strain ATCC 35678 / DSM 2160 / CIP 103997 / JCM 8858 / NBRC 14720 / NCIMB 2260 / Gabara) TaxID=348780 RepID=A0A1U7EZG4_NATPD|nr:NADH:flavin oxidoreductase/NADH oxidase [Natronomonas pharaonis]CAI50704.1 NamA family oxidoreductase [Natronomonas pharaonis DSM 2160]